MNVHKIFINILIVTLVISALACQSASKESNNASNQNANSLKKVNDFTERLKAVQDVNYDYIYAFRRKDGSEFDKEDKTFVKQNAPFATNQWVLTNDGKVVIAGSNYKFTAANLENLRNRFNVEDYSTKIDVENVNSNVNVVNKPAKGNINKSK